VDVDAQSILGAHDEDLGVGEHGQDGHPQLVGDLGHAREAQADELLAMAREELVEAVVGEVVAGVEVERLQVPGVPQLHPRLEDGVCHAVELAGGEEAQVRDPGQEVHEALGAQVCRSHVQLLERDFFPFDCHYML